MYLPGKILKTGKAWNPDYPVANATAEAWVIDMNQVSPSWRQVQSMAFPRTQHQLTVLPDGSVLATGGGRNSDVNDTANAVLAAELWDPLTETWRTLSSGAVPRLYHSSATLLPDGRVEVSGGGHPPGFGVAEFRTEIFSPPYMFKGARPTISSAPSQANYGQNFFVATPDGSSIAKVALIPQPTPTHAFNSNSGYVPLTFSQTAGGLTVTAPSNGNIAPPGMYMMFVINANGVPSVASWVHVSAAGQASLTARLTAKRDSGWKLLSRWGTPDVRADTSRADTVGADVDLPQPDPRCRGARREHRLVRKAHRLHARSKSRLVSDGAEARAPLTGRGVLLAGAPSTARSRPPREAASPS